MKPMIEMLEGRQLLSATGFSHVHHVSAEPAHHITAAAVAPLVFQGSTTDSAGAVTSTVKMTLRKSTSGYSALAVVTSTGGKVAQVNLNINAAGHFSITNNDANKFHLEGQLSADGKTISGAWAQVVGKVSTKGTMLLTLAMPAGDTTPTSPTTPTKPTTPDNGGSTKPTNPTTPTTPDHGGPTTPTTPTTPAKPTTPDHGGPTTPTTPVPTPPAGGDTAKVSTATYKGPAIDSKGETTPIVVVVTASAGGVTGVLQLPDSDGSTHNIPFVISAKGMFSFDFSQPKESDHVEGYIRADGKSLAGKWTSTNKDGSTGSGTFVLSRT